MGSTADQGDMSGGGGGGGKVSFMTKPGGYAAGITYMTGVHIWSLK